MPARAARAFVPILSAIMIATALRAAATETVLQPFNQSATKREATAKRTRMNSVSNGSNRRIQPANSTTPAKAVSRPRNSGEAASLTVPLNSPPQPIKTALSGSRPVVAGTQAVVRNGIAYAPAAAPENVKRAIWAINRIVGRPYKWGGGHRSFHDSGYDCSGTVSYALHHAGLLNAPLPSRAFLRFGSRGRGRWITIYTRRGHVFAVIAGLRLDTTDLRRGGEVGPRWHVTTRDSSDYTIRHVVGV